MAKTRYLLFTSEDKQRFWRVRFASWAFVVALGLLLAIIAVIDRGGLDDGSLASDNSTGCQLVVAADELNVRSAPAPDAPLLEKLTRGTTVDGTRIVTNGFRELEDSRWAADQFLTPLPSTTCA